MAWNAVALLIFPLTTASAQTRQPVTVTGTVADAVSGQPVVHALVRLGQRAMLTDSEGKFTFAKVEAVTANVSAMKPGYSFTQTPGDRTEIALQPAALSDPILLRLYPEAVLSGTMTDETGAPLRNILVKALQIDQEEDGRHWAAVSVAHTNARGEFRLGVPAGDYRVESDYTRVAAGVALLPASFPGPDSPGEHAVHVKSQEQATMDLRAAHAELVDVVARVDGEPVKELSQLTARSSEGRAFPVSFSVTGASEIQMSVPVGSYTMESHHHSVLGVEGTSLASLRVEATQHPPLTTTLHFAPVAPVPVSISMDDASVAAAAGRSIVSPTANSLGLSLEATQTETSEDSNPLHPTGRQGETVFAAPTGTYRLRARPGGAWYVASATAGGNDLLAHDLHVGAGAGAMPISIVVSNRTASLSGTVTMLGKPSPCWVYLIATSRSASPVIPVRAASDGTYNTSSLPPGSYNAIAFSGRHSIDVDDPSGLADYSTHLGSVTIQAGEKARLDLEAVPDADMKQ